MSSTNKTPNYNLSQFIGSDKPAWLVDYNGDMAAIDTQMKANADAAAAAQSTATGADGKADTNATAISTLNTQINGAAGIAADVSTLQGSVNTITSLIGNGEPTTTDKTLIGAINELDGDIDDLETLLGSGAMLKGLKREIAKVTADGVKTYSELITELRTAITTALGELENDMRVLPTQIHIDDVGDFPLHSSQVWGKNSTIGSFDFTNVKNTVSAISIESIAMRSASSRYNEISFDPTDGTATANDYSSTVPTSGVEIALIGNLVLILS